MSTFFFLISFLKYSEGFDHSANNHGTVKLFLKVAPEAETTLWLRASGDHGSVFKLVSTLINGL